MEGNVLQEMMESPVAGPEAAVVAGFTLSQEARRENQFIFIRPGDDDGVDANDQSYHPTPTFDITNAQLVTPAIISQISYND